MTNPDQSNELAEQVIENCDGDFRTIAEVIKNLTDYLADALD